MDEELISIITPTYNCGKFIGETIETVLNQTYKNWEMIIVDDESKDNTEEVVSTYKDPRIKYIRLTENSGAAIARTRAMQEAKGKYMAFLDSDDLWKSNKLEAQIKFMKENNYNFVCSSYEQLMNKETKMEKL